MNRHASLRLDALRACAAFMVFFFHLSYLGHTGRSLPPEVGRIGVLVFFVMSGYVIAYVAEHKHRDLLHYMNARFARLLSVFLPALLLTVACDALGRQSDTAIYVNYPNVFETKAWLRLPFFLTFTFENALISLRWFSNGPMWSIAYEFWYYVIYGVAIYTRGRRRAILMVTALLLAGWKIMLLAPVWFAGVLLYRHRQAVSTVISPYRRPLFWLSAALLLACLLPSVHALTRPLGTWGGAHLGTGYYMLFLSDYLQALPLLLLVATLITPSRGETLTPGWHGLARRAANGSFSVYLYHVPLILLFKASGIYDPRSLAQCLAAGLAVLACCHLLATLTEQRKAAWLRLVEGVGALLIPRKERINPHA